MSGIIIQIDGYLSSHPIFIITLIATGIFLTIYLRFPQIRLFKKAAILTLKGKPDDKQAAGEATHFQALATALSGTVGTGNIAGVALAVHLGGPSALLWMLLTAVIGMTTKFAEVTLSHKYRIKLADGSVAGGPMFYMRERLNLKIGKKKIPTGKILAVIFSISTLVAAFGTGCLPQTNSMANAVKSAFSVPQIITGAISAVLLGIVVLGGIKRIIKVTEKLVPFMGVIYFTGAVVVIMCNIENLIPGLKDIFCQVFTGASATGGFLGAGVSFALTKGVGRGLFSNEAGQGSSPIAHASAKCKQPADEGMVALLEPFVDTVIICMLTGLMIVCSGVWKEKYDNVFQQSDMLVIKKKTDNTKEILAAVSDKNYYFNGGLTVESGRISDCNTTFIHNRSIAENIFVTIDNQPYTGVIKVSDGKPETSELKIEGKSLLHSAPLTIKAFANSIFGNFGQYIVAFSLMLFAFSTGIAWCYYGDRASIYLLGTKAVVPFRILYVAGFFIGAFTDTTVVWSVAGIGIVLMSMPNLLGLLILHKEIKEEMIKSE